MPIYVYRCYECGVDVDVAHKPGEIVFLHCAECGSLMKRRFTSIVVNWGGNPPSKQAHLPRVSREIENAKRRRYDRGE